MYVSPPDILTQDFNGDGKLDIATDDTFGGTISVLLGIGGGLFAQAATFPAESYPTYFCSSDLNDDGLPELITANGGKSYFSILRNLGGGNFGLPISIGSGGDGTRDTTSADFNRDGLKDIAVTNEYTGTVGVLLQGTPLPTFKVQGKVTRAGVGLAGVQLNAGGPTTTTAIDGSYELANLTAGNYTITPSHAEHTFTPVSRQVSVGPNRTNVDFQATQKTYTVTGRVTLGGMGLADATVQAGAASTTTTGDGTYTLTGLVAGTYNVVPTKPDHVFTPASRSVTVGPDKTGIDFTAALKTYVISGKVSLNNVGVGGVQVAVGGASTTTSPDGTYAVAGLLAGDYAVVPSASERLFSPAIQNVTVGPDKAGVNFAAAVKTYAIEGLVTLQGVGLGGTTVAAGGVSALSGANGAYRLQGLAAGAYSVTAARAGHRFQPASVPVSLGPDRTGVDFQATALPALTSLTFKPAAVKGGKPSTGKVTLSGPAVEQVTVALLSLNQALAPVPTAGVVVKVGQTSATFTSRTKTVRANTPVTVRATLAGVTKEATLTVKR